MKYRVLAPTVGFIGQIRVLSQVPSRKPPRTCFRAQISAKDPAWMMPPAHPQREIANLQREKAGEPCPPA
ncbi:MAG: hypothetical protein KDH19_20245, partial [Geminicoccaceae bacterium]|nr:hypothetical protein [Geminicoccaceae bacterium]